MQKCINQTPRILLTSTQSGGGKTTLTCGIMQALVNKKLKVSSFKCGPDYIDPLFHQEIVGKKSTNLDLFFMGEDLLKQSFDAHTTDTNIAVIEGVMGYYDGIAGKTSTASAYEVASCLDCMTVLIVDAKGASFSIIATIQGFVNMYPDSKIKAVILNRCTTMLYNLLAPLIEEKCGVISLGFLPQEQEFAIESRHLGLVTATEIADLHDKINKIAHAVEQNINLDLLIKLSKECSNISYNQVNLKRSLFNQTLGSNQNFKIGIALDKAFCFYYNETFELFKKLAFEVEFFSPLSDESIPKNCNAIYFGGGYPELYLNQLEQNFSMKTSIKKAIFDNNIITLAECGGYMYLGETIDNKEMVGIIKANFFNTNKLTRFGYIDLITSQDNIITQKNQILKSHEFHYYDSENNGDTFKACKPITNRSWQACHSSKNLLAGFPHLYLPSYCYS